MALRSVIRSVSLIAWDLADASRRVVSRVERSSSSVPVADRRLFSTGWMSLDSANAADLRGVFVVPLVLWAFDVNATG